MLQCLYSEGPGARHNKKIRTTWLQPARYVRWLGFCLVDPSVETVDRSHSLQTDHPKFIRFQLVSEGLSAHESLRKKTLTENLLA